MTLQLALGSGKEKRNDLKQHKYKSFNMQSTIVKTEMDNQETHKVNQVGLPFQ